MAPSAAVCDSADVSALDAERVSHGLMRLPGCYSAADLSHESVGQRGRMVAFALLFAVGAHVCVVGSAGVPPKVRQPVVARVSVVVASLHAVWARADVRQQHEPVDVMRTLPPSGVNEHNDLASLGVVRAGTQRAPRSSAPFVLVIGPDASIWSRAVSRVSGDKGCAIWQADHDSNYITQGPELSLCDS